MSWQVIPQIFYDFLARLVPGATVLLLTAAAAVGPAASLGVLMSRREEFFAPGPVTLFLLASYLTGFIGGQVWETSLARLTRRTETRVERECRAARLDEHQRLQATLGAPVLPVNLEDLPPVFVMHDHVRAIGGSDAVRLLKLQAERRLCHVLVLGSGVLVVVNGVLLALRQSVDALLVEVLLIVVVLACWRRSLRLTRHFTNGTVVAWLVYASAGRLPFQSHKET